MPVHPTVQEVWELLPGASAPNRRRMTITHHAVKIHECLTACAGLAEKRLSTVYLYMFITELKSFLKRKASTASAAASWRLVVPT